MRQQIWPNFFIVGAMKAGTTSLYYYLKEVDGIYMSPIKEPNYFASMDIPKNTYREVIRNENDYLSLFKDANPNNAIGEASTDYLYSQTAPYSIHAKVPNAKIIMILRDPIERAFSHYLSHVRYRQFNVHNMSFYESIYRDNTRKEKGIGLSLLYIESGLYYERVKLYMKLFGQENIKILFFEEFTVNTREHVKGVLDFLGVNAAVPMNVHNIYNNYYVPTNRVGQLIVSNKRLSSIAQLIPNSSMKRFIKKSLVKTASEKPSVPADAKEYLYPIFKDDVNNLKDLLQRPLPWRNFTH